MASRLQRFAVSLILLLAGMPAEAAPNVTDYDSKAASIFAYFAVGKDDDPAGSVTKAQFVDHIEELKNGGYHVLPLADIVSALKSDKDLPERTVAITFDGADDSIASIAAPLLIENNLPFTIFVPPAIIGQNQPHKLTWHDLRTLSDNSFVTIGASPANYGRLTGEESEIKRQINNSLATLRKELGVTPAFFAYPFGEYDLAYKKIIAGMGFKAAFAQNSSVASTADDRLALPRFTLVEHYADPERFAMTASALPLPAFDVSPGDPYLKNITPVIGFSIPNDLAHADGLSCVTSSGEKPKLQMIGNRVELRLAKLDERHLRVNCTISGPDGDERRWRWFGMMFTAPQKLLGGAEALSSADEPIEALEE